MLFTQAYVFNKKKNLCSYSFFFYFRSLLLYVLRIISSYAEREVHFFCATTQHK